MSALRAPSVQASLAFVAVALALLPWADLAVTTLSPWAELGRMAWGTLTPDLGEPLGLARGLLQTVCFAFVGIGLAVVLGFPLALGFRYRAVRAYCAFTRAIHELFWALLFVQMVGLNPVCGVLAIGVPYAGIIAKVYAEILEEADPRPLNGVPAGTGWLSVFFFARLPDVWSHIKSYTQYRLECGLRSSAVLGFIGFPTLGYYLDTAFNEGLYSEVSALLILFYLLIGSLRFWVRPRLVAFYALASIFLLESGLGLGWGSLGRFLTHDIVPAPLRGEAALPAAWPALQGWLGELWAGEAWPGIVATVVLTQIALVTTGLLALALFPLVSRAFVGRWAQGLFRLGLVVMRSTPEFILAFTFLLVWGPSLLPAIAALTLHNGAIIAHLIGRHADALSLRPDAPRGLNRYFYEVLPRLYGQFLAFLFYRWEVIMRETAILGLLGIYTLGFYIDSALADFRHDRAVVLILVTAALNLGVDAVSRRVRSRLRLRTTPEMA